MDKADTVRVPVSGRRCAGKSYALHKHAHLAARSFSARRGTINASFRYANVQLQTCLQPDYVWMQPKAMSVFYWLVGTAVLMQLLACHCSASHECIHDKVLSANCVN